MLVKRTWDLCINETESFYAVIVGNLTEVLAVAYPGSGGKSDAGPQILPPAGTVCIPLYDGQGTPNPCSITVVPG